MSKPEFSFVELFKKQIENQKRMFAKGMYEGFKEETTDGSELPINDIKLMSYHTLQLMSEIGELLDSDKRWKNFRNAKFDNKEKKKEFADCFIVLINMAMFSGYTPEEMFNAIDEKINEVANRF